MSDYEIEAWHVRESFTPTEAASLAIGFDPSFHNYEGTSAEVIFNELIICTRAAFRSAHLMWELAQMPQLDRPPNLEEVFIPWDKPGQEGRLLPTAELERALDRALRNPELYRINADDDPAQSRINRQRLSDWFEARSVSSQFQFAPRTPQQRKLMAADTETLSTKERRSFQLIVAALAGLSGTDLTKPTKSASVVQRWLEDRGISMAENTISDKLRSAKSALDEEAQSEPQLKKK